MNTLSAKHITKQYGDKEALHDVSLDLEHGKIYGLIGRNGAGKTTLLSILTSQNPATSGEATLDGMPVWENPKALAKLCFSRELNQMNGNSANQMKVKEYLRVAALLYPNWDKDMAAQLIADFGLNPKKKVSQLSKGMLSMVTIVIAMASKAPFTILDEPVAGLDVVAREKFYRLLVDEYMSSGRTFIVSTHIIEEAADVFEEVIILDKGEILLKENTQDLLDRFLHVSGLAEQVDAAVQGMRIYHEETLGRSKGVTVMMEPGEVFPDSPELTVQKLNLQKAFVALCGEEA